MLMRVAVIGGAGRMGSWFVRHFTEIGFSTTLHDLKVDAAEAVAKATGAELSRASQDAVLGADLVLVCVPIKDTGEVITEVSPFMKRGAVLAEVSSLKEPTRKALLTIADGGVKPLSIHPLFGPAAEDLKGKTVVVVPVVDGDSEHGVAEGLFEGANLVVAGHEEHDRAMAVVLSLTYFMNLAFARVLSREDIALLKRLAGTTFTVQLTLAESVVCEDPGLVESLFNENQFTMNYLNRFHSCAEEIKGLIEGDPQCFFKLFDSLLVAMGKDPDLQLADDRRFKAFKAITA
jgi:prephenate dehydrogenase